MKKKAAPKATSTTYNEDKQARLAFIARNTFIATAMSMSWQLAIIFLVPIIGGYELDLKLKTSPWLFLIGFIIAIVGSAAFIRHILLEFTKASSRKASKN